LKLTILKELPFLNLSIGEKKELFLLLKTKDNVVLVGLSPPLEDLKELPPYKERKNSKLLPNNN
jgi:hypothetical protein